MPDIVQTAVRVGDGVLHSEANGWGILGIVGGIAVGALVGVAIVGGTIATGGALAFVVGAALVGGGTLGHLGKIYGSHQQHSNGKVLTGSPNVFIGHDKMPAARAQADVAHCDQHSDSESAENQPGIQGHRIAQGSEHVLINGHYAARHGDKGTCDFKLDEGWPTVIIGGPPKTVAGMTIDSETASIDGLILGMTLVGGALMMVPAAAAIIAGGAGLGWMTIAGQLVVRLGGQLVLGAGLSKAGGAGLGYVGGKIWGQGSLGQDVSEFFGESAAPFLGAVRLPGAGKSAYGLIDEVPLFRGKSPATVPTEGIGGDRPPASTETPTPTEPPAPSEAPAPTEPEGPLRPNEPEAARPLPEPPPRTEVPEVSDAAVPGEPAVPTELEGPLRPNEPEDARALPEPAPETSAPKPVDKPPVRVSGPGGRAADYGTYQTNADVPAHYTNDPRFQDLATDPAHQGVSTNSKMRQEAMAGLEAEGQGHVPGPIERGPKEIEFYDGNGDPWDVKTPPSPKPGDRWAFKPTQVRQTIQDELGVKALPGDPPGTYPNKITGLPVPRQVILDSSYLNPTDHANLWNELNTNLTPDQLGRIVEINTRP